VEELGAVCHGAGFDVACNISGAPTSLPKFLKRAKIIPRNAHIAIELTNIDISTKKRNLQALDKNLSSSTIILTSSVTVTATEQATWIKHPQRLSGICALPGLLNTKLIEAAPTVHTERAFISQAQEFFMQLGKEVAVVQDRVGMVMPRILCMLINEASFAVMDGIATPNDIDTAMKLGTNYPFGPIEWADRIGMPQVLAVLEAIHRDLGEERYRIAPLLRQLATGTKWW
jgi:3-hydroxybutyryl-CoA dehydrogenase